MPLYEFSCKNGCGKFETTRKYEERDDVRCPACGGEVERLYSWFNFSFGWTLSPESHIPGNRDKFVKNV